MLTSFPETRVQKGSDNHRGLINGFKALKELRVIYTVFQGLIFFLLYSVLVYVPFMLENVLGYTAKEAGLTLAFQGIAIIITVSRVKSLASRYSKTTVITAGFVLAGLAILSISFAHSIVAVLPLILLFGAGYGLAQTAIDTQIIHIALS